MSALDYSNFEPNEQYPLIKAISKKKASIINKAHDKFVSNFSEKLINGKSKMEKNRALDVSKQIWQFLADSASYGFNASHALCVGLDGLYGAFLKANYPYEFYETALEFYSQKKDADKVSKLSLELEEFYDVFGITIADLKFGGDNRRYTLDKENKCIYPSLMGVKNINENVANVMYEFGFKQLDQYKDFVDIYAKILENKCGVDKTHIETLIKIQYFKDFGSVSKLLRAYHSWLFAFKNKQYSKERLPESVLNIVKHFAGKETAKQYSNVDKIKLWKFVLEITKDEPLPLETVLSTELDLLGKIISPIPNNVSVGEVSARSWKKPVMLFKSWKNGSEGWLKVYDKKEMPNKRDIVLIYNPSKIKERFAGKMVDQFYVNVCVLKKAKK